MKDLIFKIEETYQFKEPWRATDRSLTIIVPIVAKQVGSRNYVVLEKVKNNVKIEDTGRIGEAKITGDVGKPTFIPGGTMLKGATQARATLFGIVVTPQKTEPIPVHCIHASRVIRPGAHFTSAGRAPVKVYSSMLSSLHQWDTWAAVSIYGRSLPSTLHITASHDDLVSLVEEIQKFRENLKEILKSIPSYINQTGVVIIDNDGVLGLEMYDHPDSWKALEETIVKSYYEAFAKEDKTGIFETDLEKVIVIIKAFMEEIKNSQEEEVFNKNNSRTIIVKAERYIGEYTKLNGKTIHLLVTRLENKMRSARY